MGNPKNATLNGDGFRFYRWTDPETGEDIDVLSVTSIRKLCGEGFQLVAWQISNVVNVAMGVRQVTRIGPRGGLKKVYVQDGPFPGEFTTRMLETRGVEEELARVRKWIRDQAEEPRDVAAVRGTVVHTLAERSVPLRALTDKRIHKAMEEQWADEGPRKTKREITDQDYLFVRNGMANYWDMKERVPYVILAREPQVWNLKHGYAGSADVLLWFLPEGESVDDWQEKADAGLVTLEIVQRVGGELCLGDYKTGRGVYTDHAIQVHAYLAGEFIGADGVKDLRLSALLQATMKAALIHIRPNGWSIDFLQFSAPVLRAFLGQCALARFLALYPDPSKLFTETLEGKAHPEEESDAA